MHTYIFNVTIFLTIVEVLHRSFSISVEQRTSGNTELLLNLLFIILLLYRRNQALLS